MCLFLAIYVLVSAQQQPSPGIGAQFLALRFIPIALMGWVWCSLYHRTPGWADCRHLLAQPSQLWKQFCWQWKPSFAGEGPIFLAWNVWSLIRGLLSDLLELFPLILVVHLLSSIQILLLLLLKTPNICFLDSFAVISPLIFSSRIRSSFTVFLHCLLHFLSPSS